AFSWSVDFGNRIAAMTASYAFASSSISASRRACVFFARPSSCTSSDSTLSYPFLPRARPATIRLSATDNAPAKADTLPPPGVGELESLGPHGRQPSVALSDGLRDALRDADVRGSEVHVPSDEDRSRADDARPRGRMEAAWPEVGRSIRVRLDLGLQALVLA